MPQSRTRMPWISIVSPSITLARPVRSTASAGPVIASNAAISAMHVMGLRAKLRFIQLIQTRSPWRSSRLGSSSVRAKRGAEGILVIPLARIPDRFSQHSVKLALGVFLRPQHYCLPRHQPRRRTGAGSQQRWSSFRHRPYLGFCCWRLMATLQVQTS